MYPDRPEDRVNYPNTSPVTRRAALLGGGVCVATGSALFSGFSPPPHAQAAHDAAPDITGTVDIGGREIFVETRGAGAPTVVFVSGYRTSGLYWTADLIQPEAPHAMVMEGVAAFTHTFTCDRPGTYAPDGDDVIVSRSDAIDQPRNAEECVAELHEALQAAEIPAPYVLVGHSLGGFFARLYTSTYPDNVVGMVLVDAYSELIEEVMPADRYQLLKEMNQRGGTDTVFHIDDYGDVETIPWGGDNEVMRAAAAASPLRPMPLAVLAHGIPFGVPEDSDITGDELESSLRKTSELKANLVPNARFMLAAESGHDIHQDQPQIVIEAVRQVVEGVRAPETWYSLTTLSTNCEEHQP